MKRMITVMALILCATSAMTVVAKSQGKPKATPKKAATTKPATPTINTEANLANQPAGTVELFSPTNWQVFQRQTRDAGQVRLAGKVSCSCSQATVKLTGKDKDGKAMDRTITVAIDPQTASFNKSIELPAGGWYRLELTAGKMAKPLVVERFGVGEVFVTAGQSNSTNCGQFPTKQTSGMVSAFNGLAWRKGNDPFWGPHDYPNWSKGSTWPGFGDAMYAKYKVPIGMAVTGHGGTNTVQWQPNNDKRGLFHHTMVRIWQLGPKGFRCVLWHQGESDCRWNNTDKTYKNMVRLIRGTQQAAGWPVPWFVAKVSFIPKKGENKNVRAAHQKLWDTKIAMEGPDSDKILGKDRDYGGKGIHFSPQGLKKLGGQWAEKVSPWLDKQLNATTKK